jgi:invasion protein IalB
MAAGGPSRYAAVAIMRSPGQVRAARTFAALVLLLGVYSAAAQQAAAPGVPAAALQRRFLDWSAYRHEAGPQTICFAYSQPKDTEPKNVQRGPIFFYVSAWPRDGVKAEISIRVGYPIKKGAPAMLVIGNETFALFGKDDKAFVDNPSDELRLIEAMKKGGRLQVKAQSERGTATTDTYSLNGLAAALQHVAQSCP